MRRLLGPAYAVYLLAVAYLVWSPQPEAPSSAVDVVVDWFHAIGLTAVTGVHVEVGLNVVLFVPLSLLGTFLFRPGLLRWLLAGLATSAVIEAVQWVWLPSRTATVSDLVANTAGSGLGAVFALAGLALWRTRG